MFLCHFCFPYLCVEDERQQLLDRFLACRRNAELYYVYDKIYSYMVGFMPGGGGGGGGGDGGGGDGSVSACGIVYTGSMVGCTVCVYLYVPVSVFCVYLCQCQCISVSVSVSVLWVNVSVSVHVCLMYCTLSCLLCPSMSLHVCVCRVR